MLQYFWENNGTLTCEHLLADRANRQSFIDFE